MDGKEDVGPYLFRSTGSLFREPLGGAAYPLIGRNPHSLSQFPNVLFKCNKCKFLDEITK